MSSFPGLVWSKVSRNKANGKKSDRVDLDHSPKRNPMKTRMILLTLVLVLSKGHCLTPKRTGSCRVSATYMSGAGFAAALNCTFPPPALGYINSVFYPTNWSGGYDKALYAALLAASTSGAPVNATFDIDDARTLTAAGIMSSQDYASSWGYRLIDLQSSAN
jgi:hypothetical protein